MIRHEACLLPGSTRILFDFNVSMAWFASLNVIFVFPIGITRGGSGVSRRPGAIVASSITFGSGLSSTMVVIVFIVFHVVEALPLMSLWQRPSMSLTLLTTLSTAATVAATAVEALPTVGSS